MSRPQWEDCKVCGGDHWTKDHPACAEQRMDVERLARAAQDHETSGIHGPLHCSLACGASLAALLGVSRSQQPVKLSVGDRLVIEGESLVIAKDPPGGWYLDQDTEG